jgi:hypothetical protein
MRKIGNLWYLKGDMHIHTNFSDGEQLEENLAQIINCGMDFCAITDHDTYGGSKAAVELLENISAPFPILIRGQEATCSGCHILAYGTLTEFDKTGALEDVCKNIRNAGGYAVAAHPDWGVTRKSFTENSLFQYLEENNFIDGVELMNFYKPADPADIPLEWTNQYYLEKLEEGKPFAVTVGSDAHRAADITQERFVAVFAERCDEAGILEAIFKKRLSVAVWDGYAFGTPEALELYRQAQTLEQTAPVKYSLEITKQCGGELLRIQPPVEKCYAVNTLQVLDKNSFFKSGFAGENLLFILEDGENRAAVSACLPDAVAMRCIPVRCQNKIVPQVDFSCDDNWRNQDLIFSGSINGRTFEKVTREICFLLPEQPLFTDGRPNEITISVHSADGVILGYKKWDYPVALPDKWYAAENLRSDAPPAGDREVSARFRMMKEEGNTILEMEVYDPYFCQPFKGFPMYMGDSIQFGLDFACAASVNDLVCKKVWELGIAITPDGCELIAYNTPASHVNTEIQKISYTGERTGDIQIFRLVLPPEFTGSTFGFNMIYNINDGGGRRGYLGWRNGIGDRKRSADWGYVVLN